MIPIFVEGKNLYPFDKKNFKNKICLSPFVSAEIDLFGNVRLCGCSAWMPSYVGNILEDSLLEIINNQYSKQIKQTIIDGTYQYCNEKTCGIIIGNQLNNLDSLAGPVRDSVSVTTNNLPREIVLAGDLTCNLSCPSCRQKVITVSDNDRDEHERIGAVLAKNLFSTPSGEEIFITLSTSGEVFASPMLLKFLERINTDQFPNVKLKIQTNGLLAKKRWNKLHNLKIDKITVTFDATTKPIYESLRRGGNWEQLLDNLEFLQSQKTLRNFKLNTRMIVQNDNYHQMIDFYNMSKEYSADTVEYARIQAWGYLNNNGQFPIMDVADPKHPNHHSYQQFLSQLTGLPDIMISGGL